MSADARLSALNLELPSATGPRGLFRKLIVAGNLAWLSGHGPLRPDGTFLVGRVGDTLTLDEGREAARLTALSMLATLKSELGSLDRVRQVVRMVALVQSAPDFFEQTQVMDAGSRVFLDVFGEETGKGVRCAFGTSVLPFNIAIEVEGQFELRA